MQHKLHHILRYRHLLITGLLCLALPGTVLAQTLAFPGAKGFGAQATGGRGGSVYHVTTLADSGPGSFRDAVSASHRIVVFDVSGYITLKTAVSVQSHITIAGQTAPGEGIGFKGGEISFANSTDIICRYIRIRPGSETASTNDDALSFYRATNIIVDHASIEFAPWNNIDGVSDDWQNHPVNRITVQNSIIADPTGQQFGAHTEAVEGTWSWFNNIFANSHNRNPLAKINTVFINNLLYNCSAGYTTHTSTPFTHDIINNYFILGPASGGTDNTWFQIDKNQSIYYQGNLKDSLPNGKLDGGETTPFWYQGTGTILTAPWSDQSTVQLPMTTTLTYYYNTSRSGDFPHDPMDKLIVDQLKTLGSGPTGLTAGTAGPDGSLYTSQTQTGLDNNGYGTIGSGTADADTDGDGMADYWEMATGSNPLVDDAMQDGGDGYTLIEHYLHYLAEIHARTDKNTAVSVDLSAYTTGFSTNTPVFTVQTPEHGLVKLEADGHTATFTPATDYTGLGQFLFTVTGADGTSFTDSVAIAIPKPVAILAPTDVSLSAETRGLTTPYSVVTIQWKDNSDNETGFSVERAGSDGIFAVIKTTGADQTKYLDSASLLPGETYRYQIRALNGQDTSYYTAVDSIQTPLPPMPPSAASTPMPEDGATSTLSGGTAQLSWAPGEHSDSVIVYLGTDAGSLSAQDTLPASDTSFEATGLSENTTYYWRIDAKNEKGVTSGAVWSFHTMGASTTQEDGLVGYWSLDDLSGTKVTDSSVYGDDGTLGLDPSDPSIRIDGYRNKALDLASLPDNTYAVSIPNQSQIFLDKSSFTISFWVKADPALMPMDNNTDQYLLCKGSIGTDATIGSTGKRIDLECKNKTLRFALDDANDANKGGKDELSTDAAPVYTGKWVNVILMRDTTAKKMRIYINGELAGEKDITKSTSGTGEASALILGNIGERELLSGTTTPAPFRGKMDEVKIYNYALSTTQVYALSEHYPQGLVGYWSFDETGTTPVVTDSTDYHDDGTLGLDPTNPAIRVPGYRGNALDFATLADNNYAVRIPNQGQLFLDQSAFSISFWMKAPTSMFPTSNDMDYYVLCKGSIGTNPDIGSTGKRFDLEFKNKLLRFAIDDANDAGGGGKDELQTDATPFFTGDWVNVILIRDTAEEKLKVYLNASLVGEKGISNATSGIGEATDLILGNIGARELLSGSSPAPYKGMLDEFKIYNYALSYTDIVTNYYGSPVALKPFNPSYNNVTADGYEDTLRLTWDGGANTKKYQLYMGADSTDMKLVSDSVDVNNPLFLLTNIKPQTTYYWRVDAVGILGNTTGDTWMFKTGLPKGLVAHYAFDESSGVIVRDSTMYHNDGVMRGVPQPHWFPGKYKNALAFGQVTDSSAIVVPQAPQIRFDDNAFSISLWVSLPAYNTSSGKYNSYLFQKGTMENVDAGTGKWYGLQLKDKTLTFAIDDGTNKASGGVSVAEGSKFDLFDQGWKHIVVLRDPAIDRIRIYIDGVLAKSVDDSKVTGSIGKDADLLIGNSPEQIAFPDSLDDIRIYNYALSEALIHKLDSGIPLLEKAVDPTPKDSSSGAGPEKVYFSWKDPTATALSYRFFLGLAPDSLHLLASGLDTSAYAVDTLIPATTYYWRVDDSSDAESITGDVWSFTTGSDTLGPKVVLRDTSVLLDASGKASITPEMLDSATTDEYGIDSLFVNQADFGCVNLGSNTVILTARDHYGNLSSDTAHVEVIGDKPPMPVISPVDTTICQGDLILLHASRDSTTNRYTWSMVNQMKFKNTQDSLLPVNAAGSYRVVAISGQSCPSDTSMAIEVHISADTSLEVSQDVSIPRGTSVALSASGSDGTIAWSPDIAISPVAGGAVNVSPVATTRYTATLTNTLGCKVTRTVTVSVLSNFQASYNRILTPNGDGINDKLIIDRLSGYPNNRLVIFDESGKMIYQKNGYDNDWEGRVNGRLVAKGTYYFVLSINHEVKIKGSFSVIH